MYEAYYGLRERPFELTPNPRYLFLTSSHREALSMLEYGIRAQRGVSLLLGDAGTGKTTLVRAALSRLAPVHTRWACINNPALTRPELYEMLAAAFELGDGASASKARFLLEFERCVLRRREAGDRTALVVDEAQAMPLELLEELRLLANIETATDKLLSITLVGQPELGRMLEQQQLRALRQRIALRAALRALDLPETGAYIAGRIRIAGGDAARIFTREAVVSMYRVSKGIPRTISVICDNALIAGFAADVRPIGRAIVTEVCSDFGLEEVDPSEAGDITKRPHRVEGVPQAVGGAAIPAGSGGVEARAEVRQSSLSSAGEARTAGWPLLRPSWDRVAAGVTERTGG